MLSGKIKFPPVKPSVVEDKFEDYEDNSTWGPVTTEEAYEYTTGSDTIKQMIEDHTENNFGLGILSVPNMMETTLLKLLNKSQKDDTKAGIVESFSNDISLIEENDSDRLSDLQVVNSRDPLNQNIRNMCIYH